jgi:pantoate--beta-alanine ligase
LENEIVVLSIYVNPLQFNEAHDFKQYPRTEAADLELADESGVDVVLLPNTDQLYADQEFFRITSNHPMTRIAEGPARPSHFDGMLTVVLKLLSAVRPNTAYFGEKDYQQLCLVEAMVAAFFLPVTIRPVPTVREQTGLALSSRNRLLTVSQREIADRFASEFLNPSHTLVSLREALLALPLELDYLIEINERWLVAIRLGSTRLIDNRIRG